MRPVILVLGWYGQGNLGDESFRRSFKLLWPAFDFVFSGSVPADQSRFAAAFIGGGNFLDTNFPGLSLLTLPVAFVGVGVGSKVSPAFVEVLQRAKAIVVRDEQSVGKLPSGIDPAAVMTASDLFFARPAHTLPEWRGGGSSDVLVMLSEHFMARPNAPAWFSDGWTRFSRSLATALDILLERGMNVTFLPMSASPAHSDVRAAEDVLRQMENRSKALSVSSFVSESMALQAVSRASLTLSLRLHGMIFAAAMGCPFVALCGHDKSHFMAKSMKWQHSLDIYTATWRGILQEVDSALQGSSQESRRAIEEARNKWLAVSEFVTTKLWP